MKKILIIMSSLILATSCGDSLRAKNGALIECYGLIDKDEVKAKNVRYETVTGNAVWSVITFGTVFVPFWLMGYNLYCPIEENQAAQ